MDGTLFLDEIGELPLELQAKLLRVLENGEYQRVGETLTRVSQARILAATNRDLRREVKAGRFRADLYHRLSVFSLHVPPLRDLGDDRLLPLDHFRELYARQAGRAAFSLDPEATERWRRYHFPGNVRELRNIALRLLAKHPGAVVGVRELDVELDADVPAPEAEVPTTGLIPDLLADVIPLAVRQLADKDSYNLDGALRRIEHGFIKAALQLSEGNVSAAAKLLGINRTTLYARMATNDRQ